MNEKPVEIYTDGACRGNPGPGGWGAWLTYKGREKSCYGGEAMTTNNRMELRAVIEGLKQLKYACHVIIHTDSQYVKNGMTTWLADWKRRNWKKATKHPVKNVDLWQTLDEISQKHTIEWRWVKGHAGNIGNEKADALANLGIDEMLALEAQQK